jgi:o-succinylbenzoate---CoA ligase
VLAAGISKKHGLKLVLVGGGPMGARLLDQARDAGLPVVQTYGLTEATSQVTTERLAEADGTTAGPPLVGVSIRIVSDTGAPVPQQTLGHIEVAGASVTGDGWLETGDFGHLDEKGRLVVAGRRTDRIVSGGENISPAEVEQVILACPGIIECIVLPQADDTWGQVPLAVYSGNVTPAQLDAFCRSRLAGFKVPKQVRQVEALPRNAMGKVDRRALAAML